MLLIELHLVRLRPDTWISSDGKKLTYYKWESNQPDKNSKYACSDRGSGKWLSTDGNSELDIFCVHEVDANSPIKLSQQFNVGYSVLIAHTNYVTRVLERMQNLEETYTLKIAKYEMNLAFFDSTVELVDLDVDALEKLNEEIAKLKPKANPLKEPAIIAKLIAEGFIVTWLIIVWITIKILKIMTSKYELDKEVKEGFQIS